jgi:uncharacterized protein YdiU (UPF0061 family)
MTPLQNLYEILKMMLQAAEKNDKKKVSKLNDDFSNLFLAVFPTVPASALGRMYDNCRQSCVMAELMKNMHEKALADAKDRFSKIPKP